MINLYGRFFRIEDSGLLSWSVLDGNDFDNIGTDIDSAGRMRLHDNSGIVGIVALQKGLAIMSETGEWWYLRLAGVDLEDWRVVLLEDEMRGCECAIYCKSCQTSKH